jgi:cytochrome c oxidase assembly protein subunit 15
MGIIKGILPPLTNAKWLFYFDEYKKIPEYVEINYNMTLSEFKSNLLLGIRT